MLALFGENNVRIFPYNPEIINSASVSYSDFFDNYYKNVSQIIIDRSCVKFQLDHLRNITLYEAIESLQCQEKINLDNSRTFLIGEKKYLRKSDYFLQNVSIENEELFQQIKSNDVCVVEYAIRELCKSITNIDEKTWWLYVAEHKSSGCKIVAALGDGIVYSRTFSDIQETERKVLETIKFLRREGLDEKNIKIISFVDILYIDELDIISNLKSDIEADLVKIIAKSNFDLLFSKDNHIRRFLQKYESNILFCIMIAIFLCLAAMIAIYNESAEIKCEIEEKIETLFVRDKSKTFSANISDKNLSFIEEFTETLQQIKNPLEFIETTSKIMEEKEIVAEKIAIENNNSIKIKCHLNDKEAETLRSCNSDTVSIDITKAENKKSEYEDLDDDIINKKYEAIICVKMK